MTPLIQNLTSTSSSTVKEVFRFPSEHENRTLFATDGRLSQSLQVIREEWKTSDGEVTELGDIYHGISKETRASMSLQRLPDSPRCFDQFRRGLQVLLCLHLLIP